MVSRKRLNSEDFTQKEMSEAVVNAIGDTVSKLPKQMGKKYIRKVTVRVADLTIHNRRYYMKIVLEVDSDYERPKDYYKPIIE